MIVYIDPSVSGISGNMMLAALVDLGASKKKLDEVADVVSKKSTCSVEVKIKKVKKNDISALWLDSKVNSSEYSGEELVRLIKSVSASLNLGVRASQFALNVVETIVDAEAKCHGLAYRPGSARVQRSCFAKVHLHEVGSADTLLDAAGTAALAEELGFFEKGTVVSSSPTAVGRGSIATSHGVLPVPPPATAEILRKFKVPFRFYDVEGEMTTPTGAAILANLSGSYALELPAVKIAKLGLGAGTLSFPTLNVLRLFVFEQFAKSRLKEEVVSVLETSVDDVSGEVIGYAIEKLYGDGALDVQVIPTITKKNRPGYIIMVVCRRGDEDRLLNVLIEETGTLGVRIGAQQKRVCAERKTLPVTFSIRGQKYQVRVKVAANADGKPEYEDVKNIALKTGLPIRKIMREAEKKISGR